jgi:DNA (cytosine-5)-methyltransferase 1
MLTVNELFAGIGSQAAALERLGIDYKVVGIAEIDKYAIKSYEAIHGSVRNYGDISKIEKLDYADFWTYSFPCQDISVAGKQMGINEKTRSGLLYQVERLLEVSKECNELPEYLMLENVKNLVGKKFKVQFDEWICRLDELGYNTYWKVLNAKNYGIPQNRERVFAISIRKDIDTGYEFPVGFDNGKRLKDILESEVDEKYYLSEKVIDKITNSKFNQEKVRIQRTDICDTLLARDYKDPKCVKIPQATKQGYIECNIPGVADLSFPDSKTRHGRVQENGEICPTLTAGTQDICYIDTPCIAASRGRNPQNPSDRTVGSPTEQRLEINKNGTSNTITTVQKDNYVVEPNNIKHTELPCIYDDRDKGFGIKTSDICPTQRAERYGIKCIETDCRIRKLTPLECWRLMGFTDEQFYKAEKVNSNSQLYKQAGNSICVDVLYYLFKNLFLEIEIRGEGERN